jgi:hypothetical protein
MKGEGKPRLKPSPFGKQYKRFQGIKGVFQYRNISYTKNRYCLFIRLSQKASND